MTVTLLACMQSGQAALIANSPGLLGAPMPTYKLEAVVAAQVADANVAGAIVAVGEANVVHGCVALGQWFTGPAEPMTEDTTSDPVSLIKAVTTTTAVLQLAECGRLKLDISTSRYWPTFGDAGKADITLRQLLNHMSGLPSGLVARSELHSRTTVFHAIGITPPIGESGRNVTYSDLNYVALDEPVQRVSGMGLDAWCAQHIFRPFGMCDTALRPNHRAIVRIAPTIVRNGRWFRGNVHNPAVTTLGGVPDNTGLLFTTGDLTSLARVFLNRDNPRGHQILQSDSVALLSTLGSPIAVGATRMLGWEVQAPLILNRYRAPRAGLIQHLDYTGAGLWIGLVTRRFAIVSTNRLYPDERDNTMPLRGAVLNLVSNIAPPLSGQ